MSQATTDWPVVANAGEHGQVDEYGRIHSPEENGAPTNVGSMERWVSVLSGGGLVLAGLATRRPLMGILTALTGGALVYRGATGHCPMYGTLGIDTAHHKGSTAVPAQQGYKVEESLTIARPRDELYRYWRDLQNLPRTMRHIKSVEPLDERRSRWTALGPMDMEVQWEAEIFNERENEMIAWRSVEEGDVQTAGSVHFEALPHDRGTRLRVSMKYNPPAGKLGANLATLLGQSVESEIREDLRRFKSTMEAGEVATTGGQPTGLI